MTDFSNLPVLRLDDAEADASPLLSFSDRAGYLRWVLEWKGDLKKTISAIHDRKAERRDRALSDHERNFANLRRQTLRVHACNLIALRRASKREAARQFEAERAGRIAA